MLFTFCKWRCERSEYERETKYRERLQYFHYTLFYIIVQVQDISSVFLQLRSYRMIVAVG